MVHPLEQIFPRNLKLLAGSVQRLLETRLWAKILIGMVLGIAVGIALGPSAGWVTPGVGLAIGEWLALPGQFFLTLIQMVVVPLVMASIIRGIAASTDVQQLRTTGVRLAIYFLVTTVMATTIGIGLAYLARPGHFIDPGLAAAMAGGDQSLAEIETLDTASLDPAAIPQSLISVLPSNPLGAMVQGNMLQIVLFSFIVGIGLITLRPESSRPLLELMGSIQDVCMAVVGFVMRIAPIAVFGLLARVMIRTGAGVLTGLGVYVLSVVGALLVLMLVYLVIVAVLGRYSPAKFLRGIRDPQLLAFSTDSSAATMPVSIRAAEDNLGVRPSTAQFVIPMGATANMGGTALYHGLATVFMAQMFDIDLPLSALLALVVTSLGASIGAPATPGVGIMILATVLTSAGVPLSGLAMIIGLDHILERFRCVMNVTGDLVGCVLMDRMGGSSQDRLEEIARQRDIERRQREHGVDVVTL